jgi:hypothetical protein
VIPELLVLSVGKGGLSLPHLRHVAFAGKKNIRKDLTFLEIRGLLKAFFVLLKHGHLDQDVMAITL